MYAELNRKICTKCKMRKELIDFNLDRTAPDSHSYICKACRNAYRKAPSVRKKISEYNKKHRAENPGIHQEKDRRNNLKKNFKMTIKQYDEMYAAQNGLCAICKDRQRSNRNKRLCVDHDHTTGSIRGLLCDYCNRALGLLGDNIDKLKRAHAYLKDLELRDKKPLG